VKVFGEFEGHRMPVRSVTIAQNDSMFATSSFDSIKLWSVDFFSKTESLTVKCTQSIERTNILSMLILPGNKYLVLGTKEGTILLYEVNSAEYI